MTRRRSAALVLLALAAVACAVNPVTGKKEFMLYSESQEIELGKQTDAEVAATYGVYDDAALQAYIGKLGAALAAKSQRPSCPGASRCSTARSSTPSPSRAARSMSPAASWP